MIKAVIFDMYETLVTYYESPQYMAKQICVDVGVTESEFRKIWDPTNKDRTLGKKSFTEVIETILTAMHCYTPQLFEMIVEKRNQSQTEAFRHLHSEIVPMLAALKEMGMKIGLITNCYLEEKDIIERSELFPYFDAVCMSCELGLQKPDSAIFHKCIQDLDAAPEECLYVGDGGSQELESAQAIGMHPIQAVWYLKDGIKQQMTRKAEFAHAESPMAIICEIPKYS